MFEKWNPDENCIPGKTRDTSYDAFLSKLTRGHELVAVSSKIKHHEDFGPFYRTACCSHSNSNDIMFEMLRRASEHGLITQNDISLLKDLIESPNMFVGMSEAKVGNILLSLYYRHWCIDVHEWVIQLSMDLYGSNRLI